MFYTQYKKPFRDFEPVDPDSKTVPDMSFSVKEIIERFTRGTLEPSQLERPTFDEQLTDDQIDNIQPSPNDLTDYSGAADIGVDIIDQLRLQQIEKRDISHPKEIPKEISEDKQDSRESPE